MKAFMDRDFLLENETARTLFHKYAENQPIYDYHNHPPPREIAERKQYENLTQLWLAADHYKWRAMRACGVDERYITGDAPEYEKFQKWAEVVPQLVGCPLYHWTHLELQRYFDIHTPLTPETAPAIWEETKEKLKAYDAVSLLEKMNVRVLCTTDDPADTLEFHKKSRLTPRSRSAFCRRSDRTSILAAIRTQNAHCAKNTARAACWKRWERHWTISAKTAARSPTTGSADLPTFRAQNKPNCCISSAKRIMRTASPYSCTLAPSAIRIRACLRRSVRMRAATASAL